MSSKKIQVKVRIDEEVHKKFIQEAVRDSRSVTSMMEKILKDRYKLPGGEQGVGHADQ